MDFHLNLRMKALTVRRRFRVSELLTIRFLQIIIFIIAIWIRCLTEKTLQTQ